MQAHIEAENCKLADVQQFSAKEIVVRVEYRYCPNLTIIDTPGVCADGAGEVWAGGSATCVACVYTLLPVKELQALCCDKPTPHTDLGAINPSYALIGFLCSQLVLLKMLMVLAACTRCDEHRPDLRRPWQGQHHAAGLQPPGKTARRCAAG